MFRAVIIVYFVYPIDMLYFENCFGSQSVRHCHVFWRRSLYISLHMLAQSVFKQRSVRYWRVFCIYDQYVLLLSPGPGTIYTSNYIHSLRTLYSRILTFRCNSLSFYKLVLSICASLSHRMDVTVYIHRFFGGTILYINSVLRVIDV